MMNTFGKILTIGCLLFIIGGYMRAFGQDDSGAVTTDVTTHSSDGIFNSGAWFTVEAKSTYSKEETGKLSYIVTTEAGKKVKSDSIKISLSEGVSQSFDFNIPGMHPGFYKINFMINVADYDDTTRKAFGVKPKLITSQYAKPSDFESFWHQARLELDKVKPEYKVTEMKDSATAKRKVFEVEMKSVDGLIIRGFLTEPINHDKHKKFAVLLGLPGYQVALGPMMGTDPDIAIFTLNTRGSGYSRDVINVRRESYIVLNLEDKNKYIMRGAILDCLRAVDFICSRPELRHSNIIAAGGSQGGFLAIATSGLDKRISFCSAANPILCDVRNLVHEVTWPFVDINKYIATRPDLTMDKVLDNLDYFDAKNFATDIDCPTLVGLGMLDNIAPPNHVYTMFNEIRAPKHLIIFRDLGHEIGPSYSVYEGRWMRDTFALF